MPSGHDNLDSSVLQEYADKVFDSSSKFLGTTIVGHAAVAGWKHIAEEGGRESGSGLLTRSFPAYEASSSVFGY